MSAWLNTLMAGAGVLFLGWIAAGLAWSAKTTTRVSVIETNQANTTKGVDEIRRAHAADLVEIKGTLNRLERKIDKLAGF